MTTIAANRSSMAADTLVTHGEQKYYSTKIFIIGESIVAGAGMSVDISRWIRWFSSGCPPEQEPLFAVDRDNGPEILVLNRDGLFLFTDCIPPDKLIDDDYAIGTGSQAAMLSMRKYKNSPTAAIEDASLVDNGTGGAVETYTLEDIPHAVKKRKARNGKEHPTN